MNRKRVLKIYGIPIIVFGLILAFHWIDSPSQSPIVIKQQSFSNPKSTSNDFNTYIANKDRYYTIIDGYYNRAVQKFNKSPATISDQQFFTEIQEIANLLDQDFDKLDALTVPSGMEAKKKILLELYLLEIKSINSLLSVFNNNYDKNIQNNIIISGLALDRYKQINAEFRKLY